jgi:hypothetical protein
MDNQTEEVGVPTESEDAPPLAKTKPVKQKTDLDARLKKLEEALLNLSQDAEEPKKKEEDEEDEEEKKEKKDAKTEDAEPVTAVIPAGSSTPQNKNPMLTRLSPKGPGVQGWFMKNESNKRLRQVYKYNQELV